MASQQAIDQLITDLTPYLPPGLDYQSLRESLLSSDVPDSALPTYRQQLQANPSIDGFEGVIHNAQSMSYSAQSQRDLTAAQAESQAALQKDPAAYYFSGYLPDAQVARLRSYLNSVPQDRRVALAQQMAQRWNDIQPNVLQSFGAAFGIDRPDPADQADQLLGAARNYNFWNLSTDAERAKALPTNIDDLLNQIGGNLGVGANPLTGYGDQVNLSVLRSQLQSLSGGDLWQAVQHLQSLAWRPGAGNVQQAINQSVQWITQQHPELASMVGASPKPLASPLSDSTNTGARPAQVDAGVTPPATPSIAPGTEGDRFWNALTGRYEAAPAAGAPSGYTPTKGDPAASLTALQTAYASQSNVDPQSKALNAMLGVNAQSGYQTFLRNWFASDPAGISTPPAYSQWLSQNAASLGVQGTAQLLAEQLEASTGKRITGDQRAQIVAAINAAPPTVRDALNQAALADLQAGAPGGATDQVTGQAYANLLGATKNLNFLQDLMYKLSGGVTGSQVMTPQQSAANSIIGDVQAKLGRTISNAQALQLAGMTQDQYQQWLNQQPYQAGLTYGAYQTAKTNIGQLYLQNFGRQATDQEIAWAAGKTPDQIQEHVNQSQSRVSGLNVGQYTSYKNALDTVMKNEYGYEAPDHLIKDFHYMTTGQEQK